MRSEKLLRFVGFVILVLFLSSASGLQADHKPAATDKKGKFVSENAYSNPALGMNITLPGPWQFFEREAQKELGVTVEESSQDSGCPGPFCKNLEIDVALISKEAASRGAIFLTAYKLTTEFQDRRRYPLKRFAEA